MKKAILALSVVFFASVLIMGCAPSGEKSAKPTEESAKVASVETKAMEPATTTAQPTKEAVNTEKKSN